MKLKIVYCLLLLLILCAGVHIRVDNISGVMTNNLAAFFYARARDLQTNNQYPLEDRLNYAPEISKEDYPPFPTYFTVGLYKFTNLFLNIPIYEFVMYFPVLMYIIIFISGFFILNNLYNKTAGFFFAILLTIIPTANFLTRKGHYTEEALGIFLILLFLFFFIKSEKKNVYIYLTIIPLTLLSLTWQIFIFIFAGIFIHSLIYRKRLIKYLLVIVVSLLLGHIISVNLIGLDYSPISIFKETYMGHKYRHTEDFRIAFDRRDLRPMGFKEYANEYSYAGLIFLAIGLFICIRNFKKIKYNTILIYTSLGFVTLTKYVKFKSLSLIFILTLSSIGMEYIYNLSASIKWDIDGYIKKHWKILAMTLLIIVSILMIHYLRNPKCEITSTLPEENLEIGTTYNIILHFKNTGKGSLCDETAFSGLHIEVENATIIEKKAYSSTTTAKVVEKDYTTKAISWFEVKFDCLKNDGLGRVTFSIKPYAKPIKINYRCWIPQFCLRPAPENILPEYKMAWRNEKCLYREPIQGNLCSVPVYAGYAEKQDYYCRGIILN